MFKATEVLKHIEQVASGHTLPNPNGLQMTINHMHTKNQELVTILDTIIAEQKAAQSATASANGATVQ